MTVLVSIRFMDYEKNQPEYDKVLEKILSSEEFGKEVRVNCNCNVLIAAAGSLLRNQYPQSKNQATCRGSLAVSKAK